MRRPLTKQERRDTAALDTLITATAQQIAALPPAARGVMLARLDASSNPLDRAIAAQARLLATPLPDAKTA